MQSLPPKQQLILDLLLDARTGRTLEEIAQHLGVTKTAAKEHVVRLLDQGYLVYEDSKGQVGRPKRHYLLTPAGHEVFPRQYSWLSSNLLELLSKNLGGVQVSKLMRELADHVAQSMRERLDRLPTHARRFAVVTEIMNELGYRASLKQSDLRKGAVIEATNCVYHAVAKEHPELCAFDIRLLETMSKTQVRLETCIARGGAVCRFCLKKKD
jgi:predicted ArsR family transcriptional regulator